MGYLKINSDKVNDSTAKQLIGLCPFSAIQYEQNTLSIDSRCRMCKLCVNKGTAGVIEFIQEDETIRINKSEWKGIAVYAEFNNGAVHNVTLELLGKARELAATRDFPVYAVIIGSHVCDAVRKLLRYGADKVFVYDYPELSDFKIDVYANVFQDFILKVKPSSIFVGATKLGRMLAPVVAARFRTGLTADCTMLEMRDNTDLVQIRPAFGGNIMAQIVTRNHRPQFCTVRYKVFSAQQPVDDTNGEAVAMEIDKDKLISKISILKNEKKALELDISESDTIIAVGRGLKNKADLEMIEELAKLIGAQVACTRPLVENGWFDPRRQIGLSGRTVKAKLIITVGISGSVQFCAGMQGSECIVSINNDPAAQIFEVSHYGFTGDLYEIVPQLITLIKEAQINGL